MKQSHEQDLADELAETIYLLKMIKRDWFRDYSEYAGYTRSDLTKQINNLHSITTYLEVNDIKNKQK